MKTQILAVIAITSSVVAIVLAMSGSTYGDQIVEAEPEPVVYFCGLFPTTPEEGTVVIGTTEEYIQGASEFLQGFLSLPDETVIQVAVPVNQIKSCNALP
jgi:hypothetical protein